MKRDHKYGGESTVKKILTLFVLLYSVMFSSISFGEWTKVAETVDGSTYLNLDSIRHHDGFVHAKRLLDYLEPTPTGWSSVEFYDQVDCEMLRTRVSTYTFYRSSMGKGVGSSIEPEELEWQSPDPDTALEEVLQTICSHKEL